MKKTLIALAVASSVVIPFSVMAWTANGIGGSIDFSGTLMPKDIVTPWEVKAGDVVTDLDALIKKGQNSVDVVVKKPIPVLGIRTQTADPFIGRAGIAPKIDYQGVVDMSKQDWGGAPINLNVYDKSSNKIGSLNTMMSFAAVYSMVSNDGSIEHGGMAAKGDDSAFAGGLGDFSSALGYDDAVHSLNMISSEFLEKFNLQGSTNIQGKSLNFSDSTAKYSAAYGSGVKAGKIIKIKLDNNVLTDETIQWTASIPVVVSYR